MEPQHLAVASSMSEAFVKQGHIVVANGFGAHARSVRHVLVADGYSHVTHVNGRDAVSALCNHMKVDLLLVDATAPHLGGLGLIEQLAPLIAAGRLQVIVIAGDSDAPVRHRALELGARDFIREPIDPVEVKLRVHNALVTSALQGQLVARNAELGETVVNRSEELTRARVEVLYHLAVAAEFRDDDSGEHTERVGRTSAAIAIAAAFGFRPETVHMIRVAAPLHDIGKIGVPDRILLKPGKLTDDELAVMRTHPQIGAAILSDSEVPELRLAELIAMFHHERWDGTGYPHRLAGVSIPIAARIVAIADVFDALCFVRPYKDAWSVERAVAEIASERGGQFDAALVDAFLSLNHDHLLSVIDPDAVTERRHALHAAVAEVRKPLLVS